jgi:nucleoid DNA-binding protein
MSSGIFRVPSVGLRRLVQRTAIETGTDPEVAEKVVAVFLACVRDAAWEGVRVHLRDFAIVRRRGSRIRMLATKNWRQLHEG